MLYRKPQLFNNLSIYTTVKMFFLSIYWFWRHLDTLIRSIIIQCENHFFCHVEESLNIRSSAISKSTFGSHERDKVFSEATWVKSCRSNYWLDSLKNYWYISTVPECFIIASIDCRRNTFVNKTKWNYWEQIDVYFNLRFPKRKALFGLLKWLFFDIKNNSCSYFIH